MTSLIPGNSVLYNQFLCGSKDEELHVVNLFLCPSTPLGAGLRGFVGQNWVNCLDYVKFDSELNGTNFRAPRGARTEILAKK